jgi:hypothetical protein
VASLISVDGSWTKVPTPITLTQLRSLVGQSELHFCNLTSGDMVIHAYDGVENRQASKLAMAYIIGPAVLCSFKELA